jgi:hypothetical protein
MMVHTSTIERSEYSTFRQPLKKAGGETLRGGGMRKQSNVILAALAIFLLLTASVVAVDVPEVGVDAGTGAYLVAALKHLTYEIVEVWEKIELILHQGNPLSTAAKTGAAAKTGHLLFEIIEESVVAVYIIGVEHMVTVISSDISENLGEYIITNPSPLDPGVGSAMYFFVRLLIPTYILAIVFLGVYIQFLSTSPKSRSRAKAMMTKMVIGMLLVSVSPTLLEVCFNISGEATRSILDQGKAETTIAAETYGGVLRKTWDTAFAAVYGPKSVSLALEITEISKKMKGFKLKVEASRTIPMLMTVFTLFIGLYGLLAFRYFMVMFFTLLFPLTIFFLCFDPTKKLGGTLLEQTLLWTLLQEFYAITMVAVGIGMAILPESLAEQGFGFAGFVKIGFFEAAGCITMMMGPIILFMLLRKLLPPL